ncbi:hypothetical protein BHE74_00003755 [Ensete ventricosum]|nr:hypothetical protein GW17_00023953 [Ensete ventricosum]RWW87410.1 hypothetical protein BHE74_00003755 [Ensete ventricosum]
MQVALVVEEKEKEEKKTTGLGEARRRLCGMGRMGWTVRELRDSIFLSSLLCSALVGRRGAVAVICWCGCPMPDRRGRVLPGESCHRDREPSPRPKGPNEKHIDVIVGGPTSRGDSSSARKAYACSAVEKRSRSDHNLDITFRSGNEVYPDHNDTLVISARVTNAQVKRIMVDTGSSADILYFDAFQKLGLTNKDLLPVASTLTGFTGDSISPIGTMTLPIIIGGDPRSKMLMVSFIMVGLPSAYNAIISRLTLNKLRVVVSIYY